MYVVLCGCVVVRPHVSALLPMSIFCCVIRVSRLVIDQADSLTDSLSRKRYIAAIRTHTRRRHNAAITMQTVVTIATYYPL